MSIKQEDLRDGPKPQRSPSAPSFGSPLCEHNQRVSSQFDVNEDLYQNKRGTSRRQRSLSADGASIANTSLRRGRPNTVKSGLPSPVNRQMSDPIGCRIPTNSSTSIELDDNRLPSVVIDTSPILSEPESHDMKQDYEDVAPTRQLTHQISKESVSSFNIYEISDNTLDQAFIGSVLETDNIFTASGIDLDVSGSSASTADEHSVSSCSTGRDVDVFDNQTPSTTMDRRRAIDPVERFVVVPDWPARQTLSSSSSLSVPKIKPSLMPVSVTNHLLQKVSCSPRVCTDSPVSSGRLVARCNFTEPQN